MFEKQKKMFVKVGKYFMNFKITKKKITLVSTVFSKCTQEHHLFLDIFLLYNEESLCIRTIHIS